MWAFLGMEKVIQALGKHALWYNCQKASINNSEKWIPSGKQVTACVREYSENTTYKIWKKKR